MDRRSWPWKKKSNKTITEKNVDASDSAGSSLASIASLREQENGKKVNYVQISLDSYTHLTSLEDETKTLEDQVKLLQDEVKDLNEKLSAAHTEMTCKDNFVKQQAKVAEEAVSGWEKADAEVGALKHQLESVTLLKLTAENRASHLDDALKECVRQIRIVKEENEQKLNEVVLTKTKQWEKIKLNLEAHINDLDQRLVRSVAENAALSRSLQEHSNMVMEINKQKSEVGDENELLKENIQSYKKEISSLEYELHLVSKELDIRNEEKNMSMRSAEAASKQHLEGVRKIAKLEGECQRLRNLVRKKFPGPAALAQMKQEISNLGRNSVEPQPRRPQVKASKALSSSLPEFSIDNLLPHHRAPEFLTTRLLAMEEETKMLKEALATRNNELQCSREICAKMVGGLKNLEAQQGILNQQRSSPRSVFGIRTESSLSQNRSNPQSVASLSEDGFDDDGSSAESWVASTISDLYHPKKDKSTDKCNMSAGAISLDLMDDFLEMERLACSVYDADKVTTKSSSSNITRTETVNSDTIVGAIGSEDFIQSKRQLDIILSENQISTDVEDSAKGLEPETTKSEISVTHRSKPTNDTEIIYNQELMAAISHIHQFVLLSMGRKVVQVEDNSTVRPGVNKKFKDFSASLDNFMSNKISLSDFVLDLSHVLAQAGELRFSFYRAWEREITNSDYIDKVTLAEKNVVKDDLSGKDFADECDHITYFTSDSEVLQEGNTCPGLASRITCSCSSEELEQLKLKLQETQQLLAELRSELASSQRLYSLAETQLKCMTESYKSVEMCAQELEAEVNLLRMEKDNLVNIMLHEKKRSHLDALSRCDDLEEQAKRKGSCSSVGSLSPSTDFEIKAKQEREELASATAKLAECQETIYLLGKQLNALNPQPDINGSNWEEEKPSHVI